MILPKYIKGFDGIRGILAFSVAFSHILGHLTGWDSSVYLFKNVSFSVDIFFIMSGIVLLTSYSNRFFSGSLSFKHFFLLRVFRLLPLHIITSIFVVIALFVSIGDAVPSWLNYDFPLDIMGDFLLLNSLGIYFDGFLNHPSWSISIELWVGSLLFLLFVKKKYLVYLLSFAGVLGFLVLDANIEGGAKYHYYFMSDGVFRGLYSISMGMIFFDIVCKFHKGIKRNIDFFKYFNYFVTVVTISVIWYVKLNVIAYAFLVPAVSFTLMTLMLMENSPLVRFLECDIMRWLGKYSYTIYLIHIPITYLMLPFKNNELNHNVILSILVMVITLYIAPIVYKHIEFKFITYSKNWKFSNE